MRARTRDLIRNLLVTPPLVVIGLAYGLVVGFLLGMGMAALLGDRSKTRLGERLALALPWRALRTLALAIVGAAVVVGWVVAGMAAGALLPIVDRGTFVGMLRYVYPGRGRHERAPQ